MSKVKVSTTKVDSVRKEAQKIGDNLASIFHSTQDIKFAMGALDGYKTAVSAMKAQVIYKKLTGAPSKIDFFED